MNKNKLSDMSKNFTTPQIDVWFKANNIIHEKTELFHDFVFSLYILIHSTYLGDDVTLTEEDRISHFNWCWNKVIDDFEKEKILFDRQGFHYEHLSNFFYDAFYMLENKDDTTNVVVFITNMFNLTIKKTKSELDMFGDLYKILEKSLKKVA